MSKQHPATEPANQRENTMNTNQETLTGRRAAAWSLGRRAADRLFSRRILPGRYLDWEAWETMTRAAPIVRTYGHGGITLTAYPSSGRVGIEVTAVNAVMDWWELVEFVDEIRKPRTVTTVEELDALPLYSIVRDHKFSVVYEKVSDGEGDTEWLTTGDDTGYPPKEIDLPATVLYAPEPQP